MYKYFLMYEKFKQPDPFNGNTYYLTILYIVRFRVSILYNENIFKIDLGCRLMDGELSFGFTLIAKE